MALFMAFNGYMLVKIKKEVRIVILTEIKCHPIHIEVYKG